MVAYRRIETLDETSQRAREENDPNQRKRLKPAPFSDGGKTPGNPNKGWPYDDNEKNPQRTHQCRPNTRF